MNNESCNYTVLSLTKLKLHLARGRKHLAPTKAGEQRLVARLTPPQQNSYCITIAFTVLLTSSSGLV